MFFVAFLAGLLSFLSPCVLPLIPSYLSFITGVSVTDLAERSVAAKVRLRVSLHALLFILGFSIVFMMLGASATTVGSLCYNIKSSFSAWADFSCFCLERLSWDS